MTCVVILTAIPIEYMAVRSHLTDLQEIVHDQGTIYEQGKFNDNGKSWDIGIVEIGAGNTGAVMEVKFYSFLNICQCFINILTLTNTTR
ncbi:hypothetical protein NUACC26_046840 [Scytonema sp. NUACC26]